MQPELPIDRRDVVTIMETLFDIRLYTSKLHDLFFEDDEGQEEEEPADS